MTKTALKVRSSRRREIGPSQVVDNKTTTKFSVRACAVTFTLVVLPYVVVHVVAEAPSLLSQDHNFFATLIKSCYSGSQIVKLNFLMFCLMALSKRVGSG